MSDYMDICEQLSKENAELRAEIRELRIKLAEAEYKQRPGFDIDQVKTLWKI